ncbi:hypothetical protein L1987_02813 [Smallanthus sonchifolius]|uniref:Uncharacterized protein n=1 Tax=Smallanthus sonchifolius TaxID=185202 RepID=A0ACB9K8V4_9ASTR|nr:hypothetical protein L1987_02813 [Smallanthus sonchifolius]
MERINVAVRARPLSPEDVKTSPWRISGNSILFANPSTKFEFGTISSLLLPAVSNDVKTHSFAEEVSIFKEDCRTVDVYESRTKDIVSAAISGFNVISCPVYPSHFLLFLKEIDREFLLRMSYMEIYNEEINDLLAPEHRKLQIHESIERGIFVAGLKEEIVTSPKQVLEFMEFGEAHRHIGETNMNLHSSRSHTIFRMIIESRDKVEDEYAENACDAVRVSVLNLVDLAGSERAAKTGAEGVRLKEGSHINKSLMTLGTVIKKLSEGAESQGGHVPYRDSKLTRILQPALGGNANTAIICNITLAQIHADETKSSLQFASRALRVTNCVHVNEILTDAALLKRQKKEIEELRAKLQGSHSDHLGEEILNLRNTLLQSELERERIALELEEEKKAQAERDKMLLEQAKKIQNLSSMVLCSSREEVAEHRKKEKRRETWCPGKLPEEMVNKIPSTIPGQASAVKPVRNDRERGPLLAFEELVNDNTSNAIKQERDCKVGSSDFGLPNPRSLIHVTSRKKAPTRKRSLLTESAELTEMREEYENLLLQFETQRTRSEIKIDYLTRKLAEANRTSDTNEKAIELSTSEKTNEMEASLVIKQLQEKISMLEMERSSSLQNIDCLTRKLAEANRTSDTNEKAIELSTSEKTNEMEESLVIKQLQEKISMLEMERSSSLQNMEYDNVLETEKNMHANNKQEELYMELLAAQEEADFTRQQLTLMDEKLSADIQEIKFDIQHSKTLVESMMDENLQSCTSLSELTADVRSFYSVDFIQIKTLLGDYEKVLSCMKSKVDDLEREKLLMYNQSEDLQKRIEEAFLNGENSAKALTELSERYETEKQEFLSEIVTLQDEISHLSSSVMAKEKESMRKELEKTKSKLKETEFKLRNTIQEKTKLEEEYKKLEVLAFEMETTIGSLEEMLALANDEKQQAVSRSETLMFEAEELSEKLNFSNSELQRLEELVSSLRAKLEEATLHNENADSSIGRLLEEKEEMAMQLTDALLAIEEERAIWSTTEKASIEAIKDQSKSYTAEIALLKDAMSKVNNELEACREECQVIREKLAFAEEKVEAEKAVSVEKSLEIEQLMNNIRLLDDQKRITEDKLHNQILEITKERDEVLTQIGVLQNHKVEQQSLMENCNKKLLGSKAEVKDLTMKLSTLEAKTPNEVKNSIQSAKLRMRLHGAQKKLDSIRVKCIEKEEEKDYMHKQFEEASVKLKKQLASHRLEILDLKKQLALSS